MARRFPIVGRAYAAQPNAIKPVHGPVQSCTQSNDLSNLPPKYSPIGQAHVDRLRDFAAISYHHEASAVCHCLWPSAL